jgi:hypothetical protein
VCHGQKPDALLIGVPCIDRAITKQIFKLVHIALDTAPVPPRSLWVRRDLLVPRLNTPLPRHILATTLIPSS